MVSKRGKSVLESLFFFSFSLLVMCLAQFVFLQPSSQCDQLLHCGTDTLTLTLNTCSHYNCQLNFKMLRQESIEEFGLKVCPRMCRHTSKLNSTMILHSKPDRRWTLCHEIIHADDKHYCWGSVGRALVVDA